MPNLTQVFPSSLLLGGGQGVGAGWGQGDSEEAGRCSRQELRVDRTRATVAPVGEALLPCG